MKRPFIAISGINSFDDLPYDPRCPIPKDARVEKILCIDRNELHPIGSKGVTVGGFYEEKQGAAYIVKWDTGIPSACIAKKIKQIK